MPDEALKHEARFSPDLVPEGSWYTLPQLMDLSDKPRPEVAALMSGRRERAREVSEVNDLERLYIQGELRRHPLLDQPQEVALAKHYEEGRSAGRFLDPEAGLRRFLSPRERRHLGKLVTLGDKAKEQFANSNLRLVVSIAKRYRSSGLPVLDLIQEGNLGLLKAVDKFDWRKGFKFSTYATWWITQSIDRGIVASGRTIRLTGDTIQLQAAISKAVNNLSLTLGRAPSVEEVATEVGISPEKVEMALTAPAVTTHFEDPVGEDAQVGDFLPDTDGVSPESYITWLGGIEDIKHMLTTLKGRDRDFVIVRFGLRDGQPKSLEEMGQIFGFTRERARQIDTEIIYKLRRLYDLSDELPKRARYSSAAMSAAFRVGQLRNIEEATDDTIKKFREESAMTEQEIASLHGMTLEEWQAEQEKRAG